MVKKIMYKGFEVRINKIEKDCYDWEIYAKSPLDKDKNEPFMMREGTAYVENEKMVLEIAKEVINEELL